MRPPDARGSLAAVWRRHAWATWLVRAKLIAFGELEIEGERYGHDLVGPLRPVRTHAPLARRRHLLGRRAAHRRHGRRRQPPDRLGRLCRRGATRDGHHGTPHRQCLPSTRDARASRGIRGPPHHLQAGATLRPPGVPVTGRKTSWARGSTPEASSAPIEGVHPAYVEWYSGGARSVKAAGAVARRVRPTSRANLAERSRELTPMDHHFLLFANRAPFCPCRGR